MYKCVFRLGVFLTLLLSFSCQSSKIDKPGVNHVVLCWLKDKSNDQKEVFLKAVKSLGDIPEVESISCGDISPSIEPVADNSFDVGFIIKFKNQSDLKTYLTHPVHVKAVTDVLKPALKKVVVYDFKSN